MSESSCRWIFSNSQLQQTPSRKDGIDELKELSYRQQTANVIQEMGQRLSVTQLCINTAIAYMHRFYMMQSFLKFPKEKIAASIVFLATKVEEQPRKLEHVIQVAHVVDHRHHGLPLTPLDVKSEEYLERAQCIVVYESIVLQTLGFELTVDHPHVHVIKTCDLVKATKDLTQTSYFLATNSLLLTTMCVQYSPAVVACVCIHVACKWASWEIPKSSEGKDWWFYADKDITVQMLEELTQEFLNKIDSSKSRMKKRSMSYKMPNSKGTDGDGQPLEKRPKIDQKQSVGHSRSSTDASHHRSSSSSQSLHKSQQRHRPSTSPRPSTVTSAQQKHSLSQPISTSRQSHSAAPSHSSHGSGYSSVPGSRSSTPVAHSSHVHHHQHPPSKNHNQGTPPISKKLVIPYST